jgi:hypothetical protein
MGEFRLIRIANTQLCVQPLGGSTGDVPIELTPCISTAGAQNWLFVQKSSSEWQIVNQQSGKCRYVDTGSPTFNGAPVIHSGCNIFGTNVPVSNAAWRPSILTSLSTLMSRIGHRNSGFCLDVPGGNAFAGARPQMWQCNGTPAQAWIVGVE